MQSNKVKDKVVPQEAKQALIKLFQEINKKAADSLKEKKEEKLLASYKNTLHVYEKLGSQINSTLKTDSAIKEECAAALPNIHKYIQIILTTYSINDLTLEHIDTLKRGYALLSRWDEGSNVLTELDEIVTSYEKYKKSKESADDKTLSLEDLWTAAVGILQAANLMASLNGSCSHVIDAMDAVNWLKEKLDQASPSGQPMYLIPSVLLKKWNDHLDLICAYCNHKISEYRTFLESYRGKLNDPDYLANLKHFYRLGKIYAALSIEPRSQFQGYILMSEACRLLGNQKRENHECAAALEYYNRALEHYFTAIDEYGIEPSPVRTVSLLHSRVKMKVELKLYNKALLDINAILEMNAKNEEAKKNKNHLLEIIAREFNVEHPVKNMQDAVRQLLQLKENIKSEKRQALKLSHNFATSSPPKDIKEKVAACLVTFEEAIQYLINFPIEGTVRAKIIDHKKEFIDLIKILHNLLSVLEEDLVLKRKLCNVMLRLVHIIKLATENKDATVLQLSAVTNSLIKDYPIALQEIDAAILVASIPLEKEQTKNTKAKIMLDEATYKRNVKHCEVLGQKERPLPNAASFCPEAKGVKPLGLKFTAEEVPITNFIRSEEKLQALRSTHPESQILASAIDKLGKQKNSPSKYIEKKCATNNKKKNKKQKKNKEKTRTLSNVLTIKEIVQHLQHIQLLAKTYDLELIQLHELRDSVKEIGATISLIAPSTIAHYKQTTTQPKLKKEFLATISTFISVVKQAHRYLFIDINHPNAARILAIAENYTNLYAKMGMGTPGDIEFTLNTFAAANLYFSSFFIEESATVLLKTALIKVDGALSAAEEDIDNRAYLFSLRALIYLHLRKKKEAAAAIAKGKELAKHHYLVIKAEAILKHMQEEKYSSNLTLSNPAEIMTVTQGSCGPKTPTKLAQEKSKDVAQTAEEKQKENKKEEQEESFLKIQTRLIELTSQVKSMEEHINKIKNEKNKFNDLSKLTNNNETLAEMEQQHKKILTLINSTMEDKKPLDFVETLLQTWKSLNKAMKEEVPDGPKLKNLKKEMNQLNNKLIAQKTTAKTWGTAAYAKKLAEKIDHYKEKQEINNFTNILKEGVKTLTPQVATLEKTVALEFEEKLTFNSLQEKKQHLHKKIQVLEAFQKSLELKNIKESLHTLMPCVDALNHMQKNNVALTEFKRANLDTRITKVEKNVAQALQAYTAELESINKSLDKEKTLILKIQNKLQTAKNLMHSTLEMQEFEFAKEIKCALKNPTQALSLVNLKKAAFEKTFLQHQNNLAQAKKLLEEATTLNKTIAEEKVDISSTESMYASYAETIKTKENTFKQQQVDAHDHIVQEAQKLATIQDNIGHEIKNIHTLLVTLEQVNTDFAASCKNTQDLMHKDLSQAKEEKKKLEQLRTQGNALIKELEEAKDNLSKLTLSLDAYTPDCTEKTYQLVNAKQALISTKLKEFNFAMTTVKSLQAIENAILKAEEEKLARNNLDRFIKDTQVTEQHLNILFAIADKFPQLVIYGGFAIRSQVPAKTNDIDAQIVCETDIAQTAKTLAALGFTIERKTKYYWKLTYTPEGSKIPIELTLVNKEYKSEHISPALSGKLKLFSRKDEGANIAEWYNVGDKRYFGVVKDDQYLDFKHQWSTNPPRPLFFAYDNKQRNYYHVVLKAKEKFSPTIPIDDKCMSIPAPSLNNPKVKLYTAEEIIKDMPEIFRHKMNGSNGIQECYLELHAIIKHRELFTTLGKEQVLNPNIAPFLSGFLYGLLSCKQFTGVELIDKDALITSIIKEFITYYKSAPFPTDSVQGLNEILNMTQRVFATHLTTPVMPAQPIFSAHSPLSPPAHFFNFSPTAKTLKSPPPLRPVPSSPASSRVPSRAALFTEAKSPPSPNLINLQDYLAMTKLDLSHVLETQRVYYKDVHTNTLRLGTTKDFIAFSQGENPNLYVLTDFNFQQGFKVTR